MVSFPTPFVVQLQHWTLSPPNHLGERVKELGPPVDVSVYGWAPPSVEEEIYSANRDGVVHDLDVYAPPGVDARADDQVTISGSSYRVIGGSRSFDSGPFGFHPGSVIRVKRVSELG